MACSERGMALVSVLLILAVLLTMAHILAEKCWQSTRLAAAAAGREQLFWAAQAGIEAARRRLAVDYAGTGGWQTLLTAGGPLAYPAAPAWVEEVAGRRVEIFLRDNPDGDDDPRRDDDLKLFVLARAVGDRGETAMVECLCGFAASDAGAGPAATVDLAALPVHTGSITD